MKPFGISRAMSALAYTAVPAPLCQEVLAPPPALAAEVDSRRPQCAGASSPHDWPSQLSARTRYGRDRCRVSDDQVEGWRSCDSAQPTIRAPASSTACGGLAGDSCLLLFASGLSERRSGCSARLRAGSPQPASRLARQHEARRGTLASGKQAGLRRRFGLGLETPDARRCVAQSLPARDLQGQRLREGASRRLGTVHQRRSRSRLIDATQPAGPVVPTERCNEVASNLLRASLRTPNQRAHRQKPSVILSVMSD